MVHPAGSVVTIRSFRLYLDSYTGHGLSVVLTVLTAAVVVVVGDLVVVAAVVVVGDVIIIGLLVVVTTVVLTSDVSLFVVILPVVSTV